MSIYLINTHHLLFYKTTTYLHHYNWTLCIIKNATGYEFTGISKISCTHTRRTVQFNGNGLPPKPNAHPTKHSDLERHRIRSRDSATTEPPCYLTHDTHAHTLPLPLTTAAAATLTLVTTPRLAQPPSPTSSPHTNTLVLLSLEPTPSRHCSSDFRFPPSFLGRKIRGTPYKLV